MNEEEKKLAEQLLKLSLASAKYVKHYFELMKAVKFRLVIEKLTKK